ncbi:MAG: hypothetical protein EOO06_20070 [Chitinophagaceae bacterium]|nr:MAG: hypothetical protein EOO06_20070 [Chitinophagaceae bacterium]
MWLVILFNKPWQNGGQGSNAEAVRRMENGEWRMENGEWRMENGEWRMENGEKLLKVEEE